MSGRWDFDPKDIKFILSTELHWDHAAGLALARDTGATCRREQKRCEGLRTGNMRPTTRSPPMVAAGPAVTTPIRIMKDGEVPLGTARITARATPGHTMGSMSWSWRSCEGKVCKEIVFAASLNPVSSDEYRFSSAAERHLCRICAQLSDRVTEMRPADYGASRQFGRRRFSAKAGVPRLCRAVAPGAGQAAGGGEGGRSEVAGRLSCPSRSDGEVAVRRTDGGAWALTSPPLHHSLRERSRWRCAPSATPP